MRLDHRGLARGEDSSCGRIDAEVERIRKSRAAMREWSDDYTKPPPLKVIADDDGVARIAETWAHRNADDKAEAA